MHTPGQNHASIGRPEESADVLIVGGGPTGLLLANLLGTMKVRTILVERNAGTVQEPRAVSIDDESMRALQAVGLAEHVQSIVVRGYGSIYRGPDKRPFAMVKPFVREYGFDKRNAFQQPELEGILRSALDRFECVTAHYRCGMTSFEDRGNHVQVILRGEDGSRRSVRTKFMVACDGGRSGIRKHLGIDLEGSTFEEPWLIVDLASTRNRCFHTEVFCDPKRSCITLPGPNGIRRYEFKLHKHEDLEEVQREEFVRQLLAEVGPDRDETFRRIRVYTFHARTASRWREGRVLLAGDAAHLTPPFAGQGMNSGLRDAHNLAWKLSEALTAREWESLLDSYEVERKPHAWAMIALALRMGQVMTPTSRLQGALVRAGFRALGIYPPARDYFAQMKYKPKARFRHGLVWPDPGAPDLGVTGVMIPQPEVETTSRQRLLLDELLPDALTLLIYSERPEEAIGADLRSRFCSAGVHVFGLTPEWCTPVSSPVPAARDASRFFSRPPYDSLLEHAVLVRRDRYIASTRPVDRADELLRYVGVLSPRDGAADERATPMDANPEATARNHRTYRRTLFATGSFPGLSASKLT